MAAQVALRNRSKDELGRKLAAVGELKSVLAAYAREHGGRFILFGSAARREMRPDSDVDILIDFPVQLELKAADFAENEGRRRGLEPDVLPIHWTGERLRARLKKEGLFLPGDEDRWAGAMSMEDRLSDILDAARSAATHFRAAGRLFGRGGFDEEGDEGYRNVMALLHAMLSGHNALEDALVRLMKVLGEAPPSGSDWHMQVIERASMAKAERPAVLPSALAKAANETRGFRHFAARAYRVKFDPEKARVAVEAGQVLAEGLEDALSSFLKIVPPS